MKFVRIGTRSSNEFMQSLNEINTKIQEKFIDHVKDLTKPAEISVMLGDNTVIKQKTFDPMSIQKYFENITRHLTDWEVQDITITNNEDLRRIFIKFEIREGNYLISGHLSLQFHVLLYYKPDNKVIEYQKELSEILDKTKQTESRLSDEGDQFVLNKLKEMGYKDLDYQNLFEVFFNNDELREKVYRELEEQGDTDFQILTQRKTELFNELDNLLIETYQIVPVLIDDVKLIAGEEGCLCYFDMEFIKNKTKEGNFDPKKISTTVQEQIKKRCNQIFESLVT